MKDLSKFIQEKKEDDAKPKKGEGADDKAYLKLMSDYKVARRGDAKKANKILAKAEKLAKDGDVSKQAKITAAYL